MGCCLGVIALIFPRVALAVMWLGGYGGRVRDINRDNATAGKGQKQATLRMKQMEQLDSDFPGAYFDPDVYARSIPAMLFFSPSNWRPIWSIPVFADAPSTVMRSEISLFCAMIQFHPLTVLDMLTPLYYLLLAIFVIGAYSLLGIVLWSISSWAFVFGALALGMAAVYQFRDAYRRGLEQAFTAAGLPLPKR